MNSQAQRFFCSNIPRDLLDESSMVALEKDQSHHIKKVLRLGAGQAVELFDGCGLVAQAVVEKFEQGQAVCKINEIKDSKPLRPQLIVASAVPKGSRGDGIIDQLSQLGVNKFIPLRTQRSEVDPRPNKLNRYQTMAIESARQCRRDFSMEIDNTRDFAEVITWPFDLKLIGATENVMTPDDFSSQIGAAENILIAIGPEGDFTPEELSSAADAGFVPWHFANHILRVGTAAGAAATIVRYMANHQPPTTNMFGSHLSIAGGMENALYEAKRLHMDCVQVFTKNQRQWNVAPLKAEQIKKWNSAKEETGITDVVSHASYLINLCSTKKETKEKSVALYEQEIVRCAKLGIDNLVIHPGSHLGAGEEEGLEQIAEALKKLHDKTSGAKVYTCLEITAGQGTNLGYTFEHLAKLIELIDQPKRVGVCLDTAHLLGAGYDLTSAKGARQVLKGCDNIIGLDKVRAIHVNDSKVELASRKDRHEHIGLGFVSMDAFKVIVNEPKFNSIPKILETPKEIAPDGRLWDVVNLEKLHEL